MTKTTVAIIGGGISGLSAAYALHKRQVPYLLLEAGREPRRGDPDRDPGRLPARGRAGLDARPEAGGHRPLPRARPRRAARAHEPRPALGLRPPPAEAPPAARGDDAGRPHEDPALRPERSLLLAGQAPHGARPRDSRAGTAAATSRSRPSCGAGSGRRRSSGSASRSSPASTPATRSGSRSSPPFPRFRDLEAKHGSLVRGMWATPRPKPAPGGEAARRLLLAARRAARDGGRARRAPRAGADLDEGRRPRGGPAPETGSRSPSTGGETVSADRVIVAAPGRGSPPPSRASCPARRGRSPRSRSRPRRPSSSATAARTSPTPSTATAWWSRRREGLRTTALSFVSTKFPHRAPEGHVLLRGFLGGVRDGEVMTLTRRGDGGDGEARHGRDPRTARRSRSMSRVFRWPGGTPQLEVGHLERMGAVEKEVASVPGLHLTGAGIRSTGIPDSVADGTRVGEAAAGVAPVRHGRSPCSLVLAARRVRAPRRPGPRCGQRRRRLGRLRPGLPLGLRLVASPGGRRG